ncbi:MAG: hypothetical protein AB9833_04320 [Bacteroidales bacterium]
MEPVYNEEISVYEDLITNETVIRIIVVDEYDNKLSVNNCLNKLSCTNKEMLNDVLHKICKNLDE